MDDQHPEFTQRQSEQDMTLDRRTVLKTLAAGLVVLPALRAINSGIMPETPRFNEAVDSLATPESVTLSSSSWNAMPGASVAPDGVHVRRVDRAIKRLDDASYQPNYPCNYALAGQVQGNMSVQINLEDIRGQAGVTLLGSAPIIADEARFDKDGGLRITMQGDSLQVNLLRGDTERQLGAATLKPSTAADIRVTHKGGMIYLRVNGQALHIPDHGLFATGQLWTGFDTTGNMTVTRLAPAPVYGGKLSFVDNTVLPDYPPQSLNLQVLAGARGVTLATTTDMSEWAANKAAARLTFGGNFGKVTLTNGGKMQNIQPRHGVFVWNEADETLKQARARNMQVHWHTLVFGEANPAWLQKLAAQHPEQMEAVMLQHIAATGNHLQANFPGLVKTVDVINEPINEAGTGMRKNVWQQTVPNYIAKAFAAAKVAFPDSKLGINEWGLENDPDRMEYMYKLVYDLKVSQKVPIDFIGMQFHIDSAEDVPKYNVLKKYIPLFRSIGVEVRISELDVDGEDPVWQANMYRDIISFAVSHGIKDIGMWGTKTGTGATTEVEDGNLSYYNSLPWDGKGRARPAVAAIQAALR